MDPIPDQLIRLAASYMPTQRRRLFIAEVAEQLCGGNAREAENRFGWGRETIKKGQREKQTGIECVDHFQARGRSRSEERNPQLAEDIRALVDPHTQADPELKSARRYTDLTAREVREALLEDKGYDAEELPSERTLRDILNRMNYRLKRLQKSKPLKKPPETDAIFENVQSVREQARDDPESLEISVDTKAKVALGDYARGGKNPNRCTGTNRKSLGS